MTNFVNRRLFSTLPLREDIVRLLVRENFGKEQAEKIVDSLDAAVIDSIKRNSWRHLPVEEYEKLIRSCQENVEGHRKEIHNLNQSNAANVASDQTFLMNEITRTRQKLKEEAQQLESSVQLDLSLERKRRMEMATDIENKAKVTATYVEDKAAEVQKSLKDLSKQIMTSISAIGVSVFVLYFGSKLFSS